MGSSKRTKRHNRAARDTISRPKQSREAKKEDQKHLDAAQDPYTSQAEGMLEVPSDSTAPPSAPTEENMPVEVSAIESKDDVKDNALNMQGDEENYKEQTLEDTAIHQSPSNELLDEEEAYEEPAFHTSILKASVQDILARDSISAMAVSLDHIALGLQSGMIFVLSRKGHLEKGFRFHSAPVLDIVFDSTGEFVGSAGMDGIVAIASLTSSEQYEFDFHRPMRSIALEPQFGGRSSRAFVCGGMSGVLVYREKRWFGYKETILHHGEGPIWAVTWHGRWIAWANDRGVRIIEASMHEIITLIPTPPNSPRPELVRYSLHWRDSNTLLIAQSDRITVASIRSRHKATEDEVRAAMPTVPTLSGLVSSLAPPSQELHEFVQVTDIFQLDCLVSDIAWSIDAMITLAYLVDEADLASLDNETLRVHPSQPPELRSINRQGEELSSHALDIPEFKRFHCNEFHLRASLEPKRDPVLQEDVLSPVFYIASPKRIYVLRLRDERDHIQWLLEHDEYREALEALEALGSGPAAAFGFDVAAVGRDYLTHLIQDLHDYTTAAQLFPLLLRSDVAAWEHFVFLMLDHGQVKLLLPYVPTKDPELSEVAYDMILVHLLRSDQQALLTTLRTWPGHLYSTQAVATAIEDQARNSRVLLECLAQLFLANQKPGKALLYLLRLRHPSVFPLIRENDLLIDVQHKIGTLVELDQDLAGSQEPKESELVLMLVHHTHTVPIQRAMHQFEPYPWYQYLYLDALFEKDPSLIVPYANKLVRLYSDYHYAKLMHFLRSMSSVYSFKEAYKVCEERGHVPEMVFLRGRTGDLPGALNLILERLNDVEMAIEFVQQQDDADLWHILLVHSCNKPDYVRGLLEHAGGEIDPVRIIRPIEPGLVIPGLRPALIKTLRNFHLQHSLLAGGMSVLMNHTQELIHRYQSALSAAVACDGTYCHAYPPAQALCTICQAPLLQDFPHAPIALFLCMHAAHISCIQPQVAHHPSLLDPHVEPVSLSTTRLYANARETRIGHAPMTLFPPQEEFLSCVQDPTPSCTPGLTEQLQHQSLAKQGCPTCAKEKMYCLSD